MPSDTAVVMIWTISRVPGNHRGEEPRIMHHELLQEWGLRARCRCLFFLQGEFIGTHNTDQKRLTSRATSVVVER